MGIKENFVTQFPRKEVGVLTLLLGGGDNRILPDRWTRLPVGVKHGKNMRRIFGEKTRGILGRHLESGDYSADGGCWLCGGILDH